MRGSFILLFLAPVVAMASVIGGCAPGFCSVSNNQTIVGNLVTIDFSGSAEHGGSFTLDETLVTDGPSDPEFIGLVQLTLIARALGFATSSGALGTLGCGVSSSQVPGPDTHLVANECDLSGFVPASGEIPVSMQIQFGSASSAGFSLQARFDLIDRETGQISPLGVHFLVPEPSSLTLCVVGFLAAGIYRRKARRLRLRNSSVIALMERSGSSRSWATMNEKRSRPSLERRKSAAAR